ncbi:MAG: hypothetical protein RBR99_01855 [Dehalococcoidales bacterium]|nr:hypothetical protein [Dehalococcoidales bacterium]
MSVRVIEHGRPGENGSLRSTIGLKVSTKERLDRCRAPGQCYDGFIQQMVDHWEKSRGNSH